MRKLLLLPLLYLLASAFAPSCPPEKSMSVSAVLRSVQKDKQLQSSRQMVEFASQLNYRLPVLDKFGLRFGADDFTDVSYRYGLSFSFNSPVQRRWQALGNRAMTAYFSAQNDAILNREISECCQQVAEYYCSVLLLEKNRQLDSLLQLRDLALKKSLEAGLSVEAKDLIESDDDLRDALLATRQLTDRFAFAKKRLSFFLGGDIYFSLDFQDFIGVPKIEEVVGLTKIGPETLTPRQRVAQSQIVAEKLNFKIMEAADRRWFDGFQVNNQVKDTPWSGAGLSFRFGVNFPLRGNSNPRRNKVLLDIREAENDFDLLTAEQDRQFRAQRLRVETLIDQYEVSKARLMGSLALKVLDSPTLLATMSAADVVDLSISRQKKEIEIVAIYADLLREYIILLELTGALGIMPLKNYLSNSLEYI